MCTSMHTDVEQHVGRGKKCPEHLELKSMSNAVRHSLAGLSLQTNVDPRL